MKNPSHNKRKKSKFNNLKSKFKTVSSRFLMKVIMARLPEIIQFRKKRRSKSLKKEVCLIHTYSWAVRGIKKRSTLSTRLKKIKGNKVILDLERKKNLKLALLQGNLRYMKISMISK